MTQRPGPARPRRCEVRGGRCEGHPHPAPRTSHVFLLVLLLGAVLAAPAPAPAQWQVELAAGGAEHDALAASVGTRSAMLGVRRHGARWLYLLAGVPLDSAGLPWGAAGAGGRLARPAGPLEVGVDLSAHAHAYRARALDATGAGLALGALPLLAWSRGPARVEARSGVLQYTSGFGGATESRWLHDSGVRVEARPAGGPRLGLEGRYVRAEEGGYPFLGAAVELPVGRGVVGGRVGRWMAESLDEAEWGVDGRWALGARTVVQASLQQSAPDPLYWNGARRTWSVGVSRSLGARAALLPPAPLVPAAPGRVEIRLPLSAAARAPAVAGDFSGWQPVPMQRRGGDWVAALDLAPGVYHYAFRRADGSWFVPDEVPNRVDDGFGGHNAVLVVSGGAPR